MGAAVRPVCGSMHAHMTAVHARLPLQVEQSLQRQTVQPHSRQHMLQAYVTHLQTIHTTPHHTTPHRTTPHHTTPHHTTAPSTSRHTWPAARLVGQVLQRAVSPGMVKARHQEGRHLAGGDQLRRGLPGPPGAAAEGEAVVKQVLAVVEQQQRVRVAGGLLSAVACGVEVEVEAEGMCEAGGGRWWQVVAGGGRWWQVVAGGGRW
jgi:hypothetical protein